MEKPNEPTVDDLKQKLAKEKRDRRQTRSAKSSLGDGALRTSFHLMPGDPGADPELDGARWAKLLDERPGSSQSQPSTRASRTPPLKSRGSMSIRSS
eukprot:909901-Pyramimonas_sp.AAC.1